MSELIYVLAPSREEFDRWLAVNHNIVFIEDGSRLSGVRLRGPNLVKREGWQSNPNYDLKFAHAICHCVPAEYLTSDELQLCLKNC